MKLQHKELGQGEPLILLHGLFGSADNWFGVAPKLAERFHLFIPDLRNHGHSPHAAVMDYPLMAGDVAEFMAALGLESARVIGHSMGGKVAMQLALDHPERVTKLLVADMAPRAYGPAHERILAALLALDLAALQTRPQAEEALAPEIPSLNLRRFLLKNLGREAQGKFVWKLNLRGVADNYPRLCAALNAEKAFLEPALFLRGGKSDYVTADDETEIRRLFPSARMETLAAAAHWLHADAPEEFVRVTLGFL